MIITKSIVGSVAKSAKASFLRQPLPHDLSLIRTLVTMLNPWIRRFTMIISTCCFKQATNLRGKKSIVFKKSLEYDQLLAGEDKSFKIKAPQSFPRE